MNHLAPGLMIGFFGFGSSAPVPTLSSINYSQYDILGGGDDLVVTGTDLADASDVTIDGVSCTITGTTSTTVSFQAPAHAAATGLDVGVTTPGGTAVLADALEAWAPTTDASCTYLLERPSYALAGSAGTWTARLGSDATNDPGPAATSGAANFDGSGQLTGPTLTSLHGTSDLTHFAVTSFTNTDAMVATGAGGGGPAGNPHLTECNGQGSIGLCAGRLAGVPGFMFQTLVVVNCCPFVAATENVQHAVIGRFSTTATAVEVNVDGGSFASVATTPAAVWGFTGGALKIGANYDDSRLVRGETRALGILNVAASSTFVTKFYKWSQQRHGVS